MSVGDRDRPNSSCALRCALYPSSLCTVLRSLGCPGLIDSGEGCKWLGMDWLVSVGSDEKETEVLDDWVRRIGEHRGVSMVSGAGDRAVSAGSPGDGQETELEISTVTRLSTDDGAFEFCGFCSPEKYRY